MIIFKRLIVHSKYRFFLRILFVVALIGLLFYFFLSKPPTASVSHVSNVSPNELKALSENYMPAHSASDEIVKHTAFTLCYLEKEEQAKWVAYHLTAQMCGHGGEERTDNFREDPAVPTHSAVPDDYKRSGYDRGHLCPAGDMGWSPKTMSESFLMSNMSPQVPGFNRGIWKYLESDVRQWAVANGDIYVVTAGVPENNLPVIGADHVAVPRYYYKVVLDVHPPEYKAIGFVVPNEASKESVFHYAVSVDSVEKLTGIDFFPALPDSLERIVERSFDVEKWRVK